MAFPARLERGHVHDDPAARIGALAEADHQHVFRHAEIFDCAGEREAVGRDDADIGLAVDEAPGIELFGIDHRTIDIGEDLEFGRDPRVIAVGREAIGDHPVAPLGLDEGLDHAMLLRLGADPFVRENRHRKGIPDGARRGKGGGGLIPLCAPSPPPAGSHCRPQRWCRLSSPVRSQSARGSAVRRLWARCPTGPRRRRAGFPPPRRSGCG